MVISINTDDKDRALEILRREGLVFEVYNSSFDCFLKEEIDSCSSCYEGILSQDTINRISKEVDEVIQNECEVDFVSNVYSDIASEYITILDAKPIAIHTISNNISIQLKDIVDDVYYCTVGNEIYIDEIVIDGEDNECISIGDMLIPLNEFIKIQNCIA